VQSSESLKGLVTQGAGPQFKDHDPHVNGGLVGAGVVVRHKQHCCLVHTPLLQTSPWVLGFGLQGGPPQYKDPHVLGGVVGAGVVVAHKQHC
jgi:hypothetical protein